MKRGLWVGVAVWVVFWSLYPTFGRPRAFAAAIRAGGQAMEWCDGHPGAGQHECYVGAYTLLNGGIDAVSLHDEYAGYTGVWLGVGLGVPVAGVLALLAMRRGRLA